MPERKHNLPTMFNRLDDQITGDVLDAIVIDPRSRGILSVPGEYSTDSRPPGHRVKITSTDPDNGSVYTDQNQLGRPDHYVVNYDVWNHRDSHISARIVLTDYTTDDPADTPGG